LEARETSLATQLFAPLCLPPGLLVPAQVSKANSVASDFSVVEKVAALVVFASGRPAISGSS